MGRELLKPIAKGVWVRTYPSGRKVYLILFTYQTVTCKETLKGVDVTKSNNRYAKNLKGEIDRRIGMGTFKYTDYFPESKKARQFGHGVSTDTIEDLLTTWLKDIERSHPHSTYRAYRKSVNSTLIPSLGKLRAVDLALNPEPIKDMIRGKDATLKTIRNDLTPLRAIFDIALDENRVDRNPMDKIKVAKLVDRNKKSGYVVDPYSMDDIEKILNAAREHKPEWLPYFQFIFYSGVRTSEGYALKWANYNATDNTLLVNSAVVERIEKEAKTASSIRTLELLPMAVDAINMQRRYTQDSDYIFYNPSTNEPVVDYEHTSKVLKYLCESAGIRFRMQRQTRHSFASNLLSGGENPYLVAEMLGHANVEMVFRVYGKWIKQGKDKATEFVSEFAKNSNETALLLPVKSKKD